MTANAPKQPGDEAIDQDVALDDLFERRHLRCRQVPIDRPDDGANGRADVIGGMSVRTSNVRRDQGSWLPQVEFRPCLVASDRFRVSLTTPTIVMAG